MRPLHAAIVVALVGCAPAPARPEPAPAPAPSPITTADEPLPTYVPPPDPPYVPPPPAASTATMATTDPSPSPEDERECKARGGKLQRVCMAGTLECVIHYRDAGNRCTDKSQCTGDCLYEGPQPAPAKATGVCQRTSDPCGCRARVIAGKVGPRECTD